MGEKLLTDKDSINTQKATKLSVKCFRDYLREQDHDNCCLNICNIVNFYTPVSRRAVLCDWVWRASVHTGFRTITLVLYIGSLPNLTTWYPCVFSWILIFNLFIVVDVVFKCLRQRSNGLKICLPVVFYMYVFYWFHSV